MRSTLALVIVGTVAATLPVMADTGKDLVQVCSQSASLCESDFQSDQLVRAMKASTCLSADPGKAQAAVVGYLGANPKTARLEIEKAVTLSIKALCRK